MDSTVHIGQILLVILGSAIALALLLVMIGVVFKLTWRITGNVFRFIGETVSDVLRLVGAIIAAVLFSPMVLLSIVIGRWSASKHYAGAFASECRAGGRCVYRLFVGNPARLFGLSRALEGVEHRIPEVVAAAPGKDKPPRRVGQFDGYTIVGSLKGGGSGGKLYIAEPDEIKRAVFAKRDLEDVDQVVIKAFSLDDGSSLPQIVRESRALDAARKLGLVIEHEMTPDRFYYVMRYVPGESLAAVTQNLHALSGADGLDLQHLQSAMGYGRDLLVALHAYHGAGLWHKDVKPDNIIVDGRGEGSRAHLVDFGLVTPLRSAMTLTTHGTEYFRDPELVRQALRGVKVHQIDGSKFDVYAAGAVLFSMIENSFPAHGGLSQITKKCPEGLRWIVRRAMAEYDRRYPTAAAMLADLQVVFNAQDPYSVKPAALPSMLGGDVVVDEPVIQEMPAYPFGADSSAPKVGRRVGSPMARKADGLRVKRPNARVHGWWSGKYHVGEGKKQGAMADRLEVPLYAARAKVLRAVDDRKPAKQQVKAARKRAQQMRNRAQARMGRGPGRRAGAYSNSPAASGVFAVFLALAVAFAFVIILGTLVMPMFRGEYNPKNSAQAYSATPMPAMPEMPQMPEMQQMPAMPSEADASSYPMVEASLVVVSDLPLPMGADEMEALQTGFTELQTHGVNLSGELIDTDDETVIDTIADLRHAVGAIPADSKQLMIQIREWIKDNPADGVLWLARNPGNPDQHLAILVTERFFWKDDSTNDDTIGRILRILEANKYVPDGED